MVVLSADDRRVTILSVVDHGAAVFHFRSTVQPGVMGASGVVFASLPAVFYLPWGACWKHALAHDRASLEADLEFARCR